MIETLLGNSVPRKHPMIAGGRGQKPHSRAHAVSYPPATIGCFLFCGSAALPATTRATPGCGEENGGAITQRREPWLWDSHEQVKAQMTLAFSPTIRGTWKKKKLLSPALGRSKSMGSLFQC